MCAGAVWFALIAAGAIAAGTSAAANGSRLDAILHGLARPAPSTTPFVEARFSPILARPLVVSGELEYLGPGSLARIVRKPYAEKAEIHGDTVTLQRGDQPAQTFSLDRAPEMRSLVASFSALLSGNVAALRSAFALDLHGNERSWTIGLTPLDPGVHQHIRSILVTGDGAGPRCLTTFQANDDIDVMLLARAARVALPAMPDQAWFEARCGGASNP
ncbi:MAG: LolA-related protein [Steroidobacteraceae bacterium]